MVNTSNSYLHLLLNIPNNQCHSLNEHGIIKEVRENPHAAKQTYHFSYRFTNLQCYPLHQAIMLRASLGVIVAIFEGYPEAITKILKGDTALHIAIIHRLPPEAIIFIHDMWPEAAQVKNNYDEMPLHLACYKACPIEVVRKLLHSCPGSIRGKNHLGRTPLHEVCRRYPPPLDVVFLLLETWPEATRERCYYGKLPINVYVFLNEGKIGWRTETLTKVLHYVSKLCRNGDDDDDDDDDGDDTLNITSSGDIMTCFLGVKWYRGVVLLLDRCPSAFKSIVNIENKVLPYFLHLLGQCDCKLTTLWNVILNKQEILADL